MLPVADSQCNEGAVWYLNRSIRPTVVSFSFPADPIFQRCCTSRRAAGCAFGMMLHGIAIRASFPASTSKNVQSDSPSIFAFAVSCQWTADLSICTAAVDSPEGKTYSLFQLQLALCYVYASMAGCTEGTLLAVSLTLRNDHRSRYDAPTQS